MVGNIFMQKYYLVYDMSPLENGHKYIQIGLGLQSKENLIGESQYKAESQYYHHDDAASLDTSATMADAADGSGDIPDLDTKAELEKDDPAKKEADEEAEKERETE